MKMFLEFMSSLFGAILFGVFGLLIGAHIGGVLGFLPFGGNTGYQAGGIFFAIVGISFGSVFGSVAIKRIKKEQCTYTQAMLAVMLMGIINIFLFDYRMHVVTGLIILFMPPLLVTYIMKKCLLKK